MRFAVVFTLCIIPSVLGAELQFISGAANFPYASVLFRVGDHGAERVTDIVPWGIGSEWTAISYKRRKAVFIESLLKVDRTIYLSNGQPEHLPVDYDGHIQVLDLNTGAIVKSCVRPKTPNLGYAEHWLADVPGRGLTLEWNMHHDNAPLENHTVRAMNLDPGVPCEQSFRDVDTYEVRYLVAQGTSGGGVEGTVAGLPPWVDLSDDGSIFLSLGVGAARADFGYRVPKEFFAFQEQGRESFREIVINNSEVMVASLCSDRREVCRFFAFRKADSTWHRIPAQEDSWQGHMRAFGGFVAIAETRVKKAIAEQMKAHRSSIEINKDAREREQSPGRAEWRAEESATGPDIAEKFANDHVVYPGRLHLYNIADERLYTITTNQADSEILLVENDTVYYRVSNRLYSAPIEQTRIGTAHLLATDEAIRDAHWAFFTQ